MRKYLRFADAAVLLGGAFGMLLRMWLLLGGTDDKGLYPKNHISTILLIIFSVVMVGSIWLLTRQVGDNRSYQTNFPRSPIRTAGIAAAAVGFAVVGIADLITREDILSTLVTLAGLCSAAALLLAAWQRRKGQRTHFFCHLLPCVYFSLQVFLLGRELGNEPETARYLYRFLCSIAMIPACYQLWGFDVGDGSRQKSLFWNLTAAYLCLIAIPGSDQWPLHLCCAVWLLTDLPVLKYLPRRKSPAAPDSSESVQAETDETPEEIESVRAETAETPAPEAEEVPAPAAEPEPETAPSQPAHDPNFNPEQILEELLKEIDSNIT